MIIKNCCEQREKSKLFKQGSEMKKKKRKLTQILTFS